MFLYDALMQLEPLYKWTTEAYLHNFTVAPKALQ
jgi:hypothetical protein